MCIIIDNRKAKVIDDRILINAIEDNPDGFGLYDCETRKVKRTLDNSQALAWLESLQGKPYIFHARRATIGEICKRNCHPIYVHNIGWLFQNGTIKGWCDDSVSDTRRIAKTLQWIREDKIESFLSQFASRFLLVKKDGEVIRTGKWHKRDGVWYSCRPRTSTYSASPIVVRSGYRSDRWWDDGRHEKRNILIGVYGTLKYGEYNHDAYLGSAEYVTTATTAYPMRLRIDALPYLIEGESDKGRYVELELYRVSKEELAAIDRLEGHPHYYRRVVIPTICDSTGREHNAYVYVVGEQYDTGGPYHVSFSENLVWED